MKICNEVYGVEKIHHVAIAVGDMDKALELWRDKLHFDPIVQEFPQLKMIESAFYVGEVQVQLYASTEPNERFSAWVVKHGGDGPHHVCYQVANIEKTIEAIRANGMEIVEVGQPIPAGSQGRHVMIQSKYTLGVEVEFLELHDFLKGLSVEEAEKVVKEKYGKK